MNTDSNTTVGDTRYPHLIVEPKTSNTPKHDRRTIEGQDLFRLIKESFSEDVTIPQRGEQGNAFYLAAIHRFIAHPPERTNGDYAYKIASTHWPVRYDPIIDLDVLQNVGWYSSDAPSQKRLGDSWNNTLLGEVKTMMGRAAIDCLISSPTADLEILNKRQRLLRHLTSTPPLLHELRDLSKQIFAGEQQLLSFKNPHTRLPGSLDSAFYYRSDFYDKKLNGNAWSLGFSYGLVLAGTVILLARSTFSTAILPFYAAYQLQRCCLPVDQAEEGQEYFGESQIRNYVHQFASYPSGSKDFMSLLFHLTLMKASLVALVGTAGLTFFNYGTSKKLCMQLTRNIELEYAVHKKMTEIAHYYRTVRTIFEKIKEIEELTEGLEFFEKLEQVMQDPAMQPLFSLFESKTFDSASLFFSRGNFLLAWRLLSTDSFVKEGMEIILLAMGEIDAYLTVADMIEEKIKLKHVCFADYLSSSSSEPSSVQLNMKNFWHPSIPIARVVFNSISLGYQSLSRSLILTGPNAAGKSTVLRNLLLSIMTAEVFGIGFCEEMKLTPIQYMRSSMNPEDSIQNSTSLFQAQVDVITRITQDLSSHQAAYRSFLALDELFTGTSAEEGDPLAQATLITLLEKHPNLMAVVATHHIGVAQLEKSAWTEQSNLFKSYLLAYKEGSPTYELSPGVCEIKLADVVAKQRGLPDEVIRLAEKIKGSN